MRKRRKGKGMREKPLAFKLIDILHEDVKRRKAIRVLERQSWGLEFLSMALIKAGRHIGEGLSITITDKNGMKMELKYDDAVRSVNSSNVDDSVFMHLDDDAAVERFIRENSRR